MRTIRKNVRKESKKRRIEKVVLTSAMAVNVLLPYNVLQIQASEVRQETSNPSKGSANKLLGELEEQLRKSNLSADEMLGKTIDKATELSGNITNAGNYIVSNTKTISNMKISADATIWVKKGTTLKIIATKGNDATRNTSTKGDDGANALSIATGKCVTFVGEGTIDIVGGTGGSGGIWDVQATTSGKAGGAGGSGGYAIDNNGTLIFSNTFTGNASILGGTGGVGGKGQKSGDNNYLSTVSYIAGTGGTGGTGGVAINNKGKITLKTDASKYTLDTKHTYSTGNINIKGGTGGIGGAGGEAGNWSVEYNAQLRPSLPETPTYSQTQGVAGDQNFNGANTTVSTSSITDTFILYPNTTGNGGTAGKGGIGIIDGTLNIESGLSTIEGGNNGVSGTIGVVNGTRLTRGEMSNIYTIYNWTKTTYTAGVATKTESGSTYTTAANPQNPIFGGTTSRNYGDVALSNVNINQTNGTIYAISGNENGNDGVSGGSINRSGGNLFTGNSTTDGYKGTTNATPVQLAQLEGFESDTDKDGIKDCKNFYILNEGDTYVDANGELQTAKGILINGKPYGSKDVFVNPQGYVYLKDLKAGDTVSLQLSIGGKRIGDTGSDKKYVVSEAGIYTFAGTNGVLNATYASDHTSMDLDWLAEQMAMNFSGDSLEHNVSIDTSYKLAAFAYAVNHGVEGAANAHVKLTSDINLNAMYWTPIGTEKNPFIGVFDGANKTIKNMRIQEIDDVNTYGLFGNVKGLQEGKNITSIIKNFTLTNGEYVSNSSRKTIQVNGKESFATSGGDYSTIASYIVNANRDVFVGSVAGLAENTTFENVNVQNLPITVKAEGSVYAGGLVGQSKILENATSQSIKDVNVTNSTLNIEAGKDAYLGGIAGEASDIDLLNVNSNLQTIGTGGKQTTSNLKVSSEKDAYVGGLVGRAFTTISNSYRSILNSNFASGSSRTISSNAIGDSYVGGIIGSATDMEIRSGKVYVKLLDSNSAKQSSFVGGIAGRVDVKETAYRALDTMEVEFDEQKVNIRSNAKKDAYLGGNAGYAIHNDIVNTEVNNIYPDKVIATLGKGYSAGNVGYSEDGIINTSTIICAADFTVEGKTGAWAGGSVGYGNDSSVTNQKVSSGNVQVTSSNGAAYSGGIVGQISIPSATTKRDNAVLSNNSLVFIANGKNITATAEGVSKPAFAGGVVGDGTNISVYGNELNKDAKSSITVNAYSKASDTFAGGMAGRIDNSKTNNTIDVSDTSIYNINIFATKNAKSENAGGEAYAGGIAGKAIADKVTISNTFVKGTSNVTAKGTYDVFAGRLFGHTTRIMVLNSAPSAGSSVTARSLAGDVYAAGLIGKLDASIGKTKEKPFMSSISMSGVSKTDVNAETGSNNTVYAGSLLGKAENTQLQKSGVNEGWSTTGVGSTITTSGKDGYVGGIAGLIINPDGEQISYTSQSATSVKTDTQGMSGTLKQGAMYGEINNVRIASSYARNYLYKGGKATDVSGGLFGEAKDIRLIQVYGTSGNENQNAISTSLTTPGIAARLSGENQFYGVYTTHKNWAISADGTSITAKNQGSGNTFKASYYAGDNGDPVTANTPWSSSEAWGKNNYNNQKEIFSIKEKTSGIKYYDSLAVVNFTDKNKDHVANAMSSLLHFSTNMSDSQELKDISEKRDITTKYEQELDYKLTYSKKDSSIVNNFSYPTFTEPYFLTFAINPGVHYGTVDKSSSIVQPGSQKIGESTEVKFNAIVKEVPEESSFWYDFGSWTIRKKDGTSVTIPNVDVKKENITFEMPGEDIILTANFVQKDNGIRRNINKEINEGLIREIVRRNNLSADDPEYINKNDIRTSDVQTILKEIGTEVLSKYIGSNNDSYRQNITKVYDKIASNGDSYNNFDKLKDPDRVLQQIAENMALEMLNSDTFKYITEDGSLSFNELIDVKVDVNDTFTTQGDFKDYVNKQASIEQEMKPTISKIETNDKGELVGYVEPMFTNNASTLEYSFKDPMQNEAKWISINKDDAGNTTLPLTEENLKEADYIYLRNVDETGYEVITRIPLHQYATNVKNIKVNDTTKNTDIGVSGEVKEGVVSSITTGKVEILKSSDKIEINDPSSLVDKGKWYWATDKNDAETTIVNGVPKPGAYLESFTIEIGGKTFTIDDDTLLSNSKVIFEGVEFTVSGNRFNTKKDYTASGILSFANTATDVKITSSYKNLLGEINASANNKENQINEIQNIINSNKFTNVFVDDIKDAPKDVSAAKKRYDTLSDDQKNIIHEKLSLFIPKDSDGSSTGYTRAEFIDIFNALTNIVYCESKLDVDENGQIKAIEKDDFTSGTWKLLEEALSKAEKQISGDYIHHDGSAKTEAKDLLETANLLEEKIKGLVYKVQSFTLSTNKQDWIHIETSGNNATPDILKTIKIMESVNTDLYANIVKFPYQHGDVTITIDRTLAKGYSIEIRDDKNNIVIQKDGSVAENMKDKVAMSSTDTVFTYTFKDITTSVVYKATFAKKVYEIAILEVDGIKEITNSLQTNKDGDLINLEGTTIAVKDMSDSSTSHYILNVKPDEGYRLNYDATTNDEKVSYTYTDANGNEQKEYVTIDKNGDIKIAKEHLETLKDLDVSHAIRPIDKTDLEKEIDRITNSSKYTEEEYTPKTFIDLNDAITKAKEVDTNLNATKEEIDKAYQDLMDAEKALIKQYKIDLSHSSLIVPHFDDAPANISGSNAKFFQEGVVELNGSYYVQEGYGVLVEADTILSANLKLNGEVLNKVTYTEGSTTDKKAVVRSNGTTAYISSVNDAIKDVKVTTVSDSINIVPGTMKDKDENDIKITGDATGTQNKEITETVYHVPTVEVKDIESDPTDISIEVKGKDLDGKDKDVTIKVSSLNETDRNIIVTSNGVDYEVTLSSSDVAKITSQKTNPSNPTTYEIQVPSDILDKILEKLAEKNPSQTLEGAYSVENVIVLPDSTNKPTLTITPEADTEDTKTTKTPAYIITPEIPFITTGVTVDEDTKVELPTKEIIKDIASGTGTDNNDGTTSYKKDDGQGNIITVITSTNDKDDIKAVIVSLKDKNYEVSFNVDTKDKTTGSDANDHITDTSYGEAVVTWKNKETGSHIISGEFAKKEFDVHIKNPSLEGSIVADKAKVDYGENVFITLNPSLDKVIEPTSKITITTNGKEVIGTLDELENAGFEITKTIDELTGQITMATISSKNNTDEVKVVTSEGLFRDKSTEATLNNIVKPALDQLKEMIDIVKKVDDLKDNGPFVYGDTEYNKMLEAATDGKTDMYEKFVDKSGGFIEEIQNATTEKALLDAIKNVTGKDYVSVVDAKNDIDAYTKAIADAIDNLNAKDDTKKSDNIVIGLPDSITFDEGIESTKPSIDVSSSDKDTALNTDSNKNQDIIIKPVTTKPGKELDDVVITIKDPLTGEEKVVTLPLHPSGNGNDKITVEIKNPDGTGSSSVAIDYPGIYPMITTDGQNQTIKVPGDILDNIFKEAFEPDVTVGIIEEITITSKDKTEFAVPSTPSVDKGIDVGAPNTPSLVTNTTDPNGLTSENTSDSDHKVTLDSDGITIKNIKVEDGYALKGTTATIKDKDGKVIEVFIPSVEGSGTIGNTTTNSTSHKSIIEVTSDELTSAIKEAIGSDDLTQITIVDVMVNTYPPLWSQPIKVKESEEITGTQIVTEDKDENKITITIPVHATSPSSPDKVQVSVVDKNGHETVKEVELNNPSVSGKVSIDKDSTTGESTIKVPGDVVKDILDNLKDVDETKNLVLDKTPIISDEAITKLTGNMIPDNVEVENGILAQVDKNKKLNITDTDKNQVLSNSESIIIDNIKATNGYVFDQFEITLFGNQKDGQEIEKTVKVKVDKDGNASFLIDEKEISLPQDSVTITMPNETSVGKIELKNTAMDELFKESGVNKPAGEAYYDGEVSKIVLKATLDKNAAIGIPEVVDKETSGNIDTTNPPKITVTPNIVLPNITIDKDASEKKVIVEISDNTGTIVEVMIDKTDPDNPKVSVLPKAPKPSSVEVEVSIPDDLLDKIVTDTNRNITDIPGDVLQKIVEEYNVIAKKDIDSTGIENTITIPLKLPNVSVDHLMKVENTTTSVIPNDKTELIGGNHVDNGIVGNEDIVISPIKVKPGHQLENVEVITKDEAGNEIIVKLPVAPNPNMDNKYVDVVVKTLDGKEETLTIPTDKLGDIKVEGDDDKTIHIPGDVIKDLLDKTIEEYKKDHPSSELGKENEIEKIGIEASREGIHVVDKADVSGEGSTSTTPPTITIVNRKDNTTSDNSVLLPKVNDIVISNITTKDVVKPESVDVTFKDKEGNEYVATIPTNTSNVTEIVVKNPDGSESKIALKDPDDATSTGVDLSKVKTKDDNPYEVRIPGQGIVDIMNEITNNSDVSKLPDMDVSKIDVNLASNIWLLPLSEDVVKLSNEHGVSGVEEVKEIVLEFNQKKESSNVKTDKALAITKDGTFTMSITIGEDDYATLNSSFKNFTHLYNGLTINGITLSKSDLIGIVSEKSGVLTIDTDKLTKKIEQKSGKEFVGFTSIKIETIPQNPQYKTFIDENTSLNAFDKTSVEYEALVKKLISQFDEKTTTNQNPDVLTKDNKQHLFDYKADLQQRLDEIELNKKVSDLAEKIKNLYDEMDKDVNHSDGTKTGLPFIYCETEKISQEVIRVVEGYREQILALDKEYSKLAESAQKMVDNLTQPNASDPKDTAVKLEQMLDALEDVDVQQYGKSEAINNALENLLLTTIPDIVDDAQGGSVDTYTDAKAKLDKLDELNAEIKKIEVLLNSLTVDEKKSVNYNDVAKLDEWKQKIADEYIDFANLFTKEYLTNDQSVYKAGSDGTSSTSSNGFSENTFKTDPIGTKNALVAAKSEFSKLSSAAKEAIGDKEKTTINGVFYGPKLDELFNKIIDPISASKVFEDLVEDEHNKLYPTTKTPEEAGELDHIRDKAVEDLKEGVISKDEIHNGESLNEILIPTTSTNLSDISIKDIERPVTSLTANVAYKDSSGNQQNVSVMIKFENDGNVKEVSVKDTSGNENIIGLSPDQLAGIQNILANNTDKGNVTIFGTTIESILSIPSNASNKVITEVNVSLGTLTTAQLENIANKAIKDMQNVVKDAASNGLKEDVSDLKGQIDGILPNDIQTQIDRILTETNSIIDKSDAEDAHDVADKALDKIKDYIVDAIKKELANDYAGIVGNLTPTGKEKIDKVYQDILEQLKAVKGVDRVQKALALLQKGNEQMDEIKANYAKPAEPEIPEKPENPDNPNNPTQPTPSEKPEKPGDLISGITGSIFGLRGNQTDKIVPSQNVSETKDALKQLKDVFDSIEKNISSKSKFSGYKTLSKKLRDIYEKAIKDIKNSAESEKKGILEKAIKEMKSIEKEILALNAKENHSSNQETSKESNKIFAWFNIFGFMISLIALGLAFVKRHRFLTFMGIDVIAGAIFLFATQGLTLSPMAMFNEYSVYFGVLAFVNIILFSFTKKDK